LGAGKLPGLSIERLIRFIDALDQERRHPRHGEAAPQLTGGCSGVGRRLRRVLSDPGPSPVARH
jgi:hypothetical protein